MTSTNESKNNATARRILSISSSAGATIFATLGSTLGSSVDAHVAAARAAATAAQAAGEAAAGGGGATHVLPIGSIVGTSLGAALGPSLGQSVAGRILAVRSKSTSVASGGEDGASSVGGIGDGGEDNTTNSRSAAAPSTVAPSTPQHGDSGGGGDGQMAEGAPPGVIPVTPSTLAGNARCRDSNSDDIDMTVCISCGRGSINIVGQDETYLSCVEEEADNGNQQLPVRSIMMPEIGGMSVSDSRRDGIRSNGMSKKKKKKTVRRTARKSSSSGKHAIESTRNKRRVRRASSVESTASFASKTKTKKGQNVLLPKIWRLSALTALLSSSGYYDLHSPRSTLGPRTVLVCINHCDDTIGISSRMRRRMRKKEKSPSERQGGADVDDSRHSSSSFSEQWRRMVVENAELIFS